MRNYNDSENCYNKKAQNNAQNNVQNQAQNSYSNRTTDSYSIELQTLIIPTRIEHGILRTAATQRKRTV